MSIFDEILKYREAPAGRVDMPPTVPTPAASPTPAAHVIKPRTVNDNPATRRLTDPVNQYGFPDTADGKKPMNTRENLEYVLGSYGITVRYNEISKKVDIRIPGFATASDTYDNGALNEILSICARNCMPQTNVPGYLSTISGMNPCNPVRDWILSKPWDRVGRFEALAATIKPAEGYPAAMRDALLRRWLISAVAAAFTNDGFEAHGALVFAGPQGAGKTRWFKRLAPEASKLVLLGATLDPANKDSVITAVSHWIVELGEVDATFRRSDIARLKAFITQGVDKLRKPYDRVDSEMQRRTVFCASVNATNYLVDDSGNRRWWTIAVDRINHQHTIDMQQLWAEVFEWFKAGEQWHLTDEENARLNAINGDHRSIDPIEEMILGAYDCNDPRIRKLAASDVLREIGFDKPTTAQARTASTVLRATFGEPKTIRGRSLFMMPHRADDRRRVYEDDRPF